MGFTVLNILLKAPTVELQFLQPWEVFLDMGSLSHWRLILMQVRRQITII